MIYYPLRHVVMVCVCVETVHSQTQTIPSFEVLAFPCNQFLKQEPGTSEEAQQFACSRFKAEYPIFQKEGKAIKRYGSTTAPLAIEADIQKALGKV
ncbi:hypothetical protein MTR67_029633 [Solanum verrucosum]|uniref:Uncharacterized protein n=1 Tax=Solanum verrucosum TaxID=315347 RepID=A0AAF0U0W9_SOLVR|nr:hypothetical protein MTR67_029633 [Solanum verrucosum]